MNGKPVCQPAPGQVSSACEQERKTGEKTSRERRKPQDLDQVGWKPREIKIETVTKGEIHPADAVQIRACNHSLPGNSRFAQFPGHRLRRVPPTQGELPRAYVGVLRG